MLYDDTSVEINSLIFACLFIFLLVWYTKRNVKKKKKLLFQIFCTYLIFLQQDIALSTESTMDLCFQISPFFSTLIHFM